MGKRKERLAALKRKAAKDGSGGDASNQSDTSTEALPRPVFRSYQPVDESLAENALPPAQPQDVEDHVVDALNAATDTSVMEELDFMNLAPRKPDWDLKRDIAKKLEKLERRTARAIGEIIRDRLKANTEEEDLASAVAAGASYAAASTDDD